MTDVLIETPLSEEELAYQAEIERLRAVDLTPLRKMVDEFRDGTEYGRAVADKCRRYYDGDQLDTAKLNALKRARQPRIIRNEIKPAVNGLLGVLQQAKVDPRAWPRNPQNEEQADVASKVLRYIADVNRFHKTKLDAAENHFIEGIPAAIVEVDDRNDVTINLVRYDELIYDPRSQDALFGDALFKGIGKWLYESDIRLMYPWAGEDLQAAFSTGWNADFGLDRPDKPESVADAYWLDKKKRRLFVVELYHREDQWMRSVFYLGGVLEHGLSPYLDEDGEPTCPLVMGSCYIDRENQRYGIVSPMISPQDEVNAYASRALHLANSRQLVVADPNNPPIVDSKTASVEAAKADGVIPGGYSPVPTADLASGNAAMMADARSALVRQAPTPAVLAEAQSSSASGRAKLVQQQAGMTEIARAMGRLEDWENEVYRQCWMRAKQFKQEPWWVRISGDEGKPEFVGVNMPIGPDGQPIPPQMAQQAAAMGIQVPFANQLADMDVDIEVETVPDTANLQAEQFEALAPLLPQMVEAYGVKKAFEVGLALSSVPDKGRIKSLLESSDQDPMAQQMAAMQQQMQEMQARLGMANAQAEIQKTQSETALNIARAQSEEVDARVSLTEALQPVAFQGN